MVTEALVAGQRRLRALLTAWLSGHHRRVTPVGAAVAVVLGGILAFAALAGEGWLAGFDDIWHLVTAADWRWLPMAVGCVAASHAAYCLAYREVLHSRGAPRMTLRRIGASVLAGFGMLTPRAGFSMDRGVWEDHGLSSADARDRVATLGMLEYALLAPASFVCAIVLTLEHFPASGGVLISWLIGVPAGTVLFLLMLVNRDRLPSRGWIWSGLRSSLDGVSAMFEIVRSSRGGWLALFGMAAYWAADIAALGACLAIVQHAVPVSVLVVGYASGYALTRRSLPLAGAGAAEALMPLAMHWMTVPLAAAVAAVFAYRMCNLWLPLGPAAISLRHLRTKPGVAVI